MILREIDVDISWSGSGIDEIGTDSKTGITRVKLSQKFFRPTEVDQLTGDASKAKKILDWEPEISFENLVSEMVAKEWAKF